VLAWRVVNLYVQTQNEKRVPSLASLLRDPSEAPTVQTFEEQKAALTILSQMYGGALVTREGRA